MSASVTNPPSARRPGGPSIFISYRRKDSTDITCRIYDRLVAHYGADAVFKDVDNIPVGDEIRPVIVDAVRGCKVVLVIIGEAWLDSKEKNGTRRLDNPNDYVRLEIETGLAHAFRVMPVTVNVASLPTATDLPDTLQRLLAFNGSNVRSDPEFHRDMDRLIKALDRLFAIASATVPTAPAPAAIGAPAATIDATSPDEGAAVRIVSHSLAFFWWPVWMLGFLLAFLSLFDQSEHLDLPPFTRVKNTADRDQFLLVLPKDSKPPDALADMLRRADDNEPSLKMHWFNPSLGVLFWTVLLGVMFVTNLRMRGKWSLYVIVGCVVATSTFAYFGFWDNLFTALGKIQVSMNSGGYFLFALVTFVVWFVAFRFLDRQVYAIIGPNTVRIKEQVRGDEKVFDTAGLTIAKLDDDFFLHWILGMGSGDMVLRTAGPNGREFVLPNVLFVGEKMKRLEKLLENRPVVFGG